MQRAGMFAQRRFNSGENALFEGGRHAQTQRRRRVNGELTQCRQRAFLERQHGPNHRQHLSARVGKDQAFAMALKQRHPQLRFQMAHMATQRRLRDK